MNSLLLYLAKSGACLALFYGVYWLFLKKETFFALNRAYLLGTGALSLVLPLVHVTSPLMTTLVGASGTALPPVSSWPSAAPPGGDPWRLVVLVYFAGAALFSVRFVLRLAALARAVLRGGATRHHRLRVVVCDHRGEPFSFFNIIFLDRTTADRVRDLSRILAHELAHVRQLHSVDILLSECVAIIQWFNPFVWPYRDSLRETHEYLADRAAIAQGGSLAGYQLLILEQSVGGNLLGLASSFRTSQIKRRLQMLTRQRSKGWTRFKPLLILPLGAALLLAFAEARVVVQPGPEAVISQGAGGPQAQKEMSEEDMIKALKEKRAKLDAMMKDNQAKIAELKAALENSTDGDKARLNEELKAAKITSIELARKDLGFQMKKLEMSLGQETDSAKIKKMKQMMADCKTKDEQLAEKLAQANTAEKDGKAKKDSKKK